MYARTMFWGPKLIDRKNYRRLYLFEPNTAIVLLCDFNYFQMFILATWIPLLEVYILYKAPFLGLLDFDLKKSTEFCRNS